MITAWLSSEATNDRADELPAEREPQTLSLENPDPRVTFPRRGQPRSRAAG